MIPALTERLCKAASLVSNDPSSAERASLCKEGIVVADVGCDHAYLSLYLVLNNRCYRAIASDLRVGPLESAKMNVRAHGCEDRITTVLSDGLNALSSFPLTDIVICGMGGDTIINILSRAEFIKTRGMRLVLQPQTAFAELALYLCDAGFRILCERYAKEKNKSYRILLAEYEGKTVDLTLRDALVGKLHYYEDKEAYIAFCHKILHTIDKKIQGALVSGADTSSLEAIKQEIVSSIDF